MTRVTAWVGAGVFTAGLSAAVLAGAGAAHADEDGASKQNAKPSATQNDSTQRSQHRKTRSEKHRPKSEPSDTATDTKTTTTQRLSRTEDTQRPTRHLADSVRTKARSEFREATRDVRNAVRGISAASKGIAEGAKPKTTEEPPSAAEVRVRPPISIRPALAAHRERQSTPVTSPPASSPARTLRDALKPATPDQPDADGAVKLAATVQTPAHEDPLEAVHDVLRSLGAVTLNPEPQHYPKPLSVIGDVLFDTLATLERLAGGDPVVPPPLRDSVEVSTSTLVVSEGHEVESNWYFPTSADSEAAPTRMIYLQHGFLANGPLYSYTASYLAQSTNSIVVTTTFTSNPFEADGMWLGGDNLHEAVAQLFLDPDRTALNASLDTAELKAGRTEDVDVPMEFVLVGHSLGGGFAPGVAGYYAEGLTRRRDQGLEAPNQLAGVVVYDAVPMGSIIPDAMDRLDDLETNGTADPSDDDGGDYIPIYEIGAPLNYLNVFSDVNAQLSDARPGQFTGVVLEDGVHMDSMQGGNPLIQVVAYVVAGFPQPQNPLAIRELSSGWINDMFDENIDPATGACKTGADCAGQYGDGDDSFTISTAEGNAVAVLIGTQKAADLTSLRAISPIDFITAIPAGVLNGLETTCDLFSGGTCAV